MDYSLADLKAIMPTSEKEEDGFGGSGFLWIILIFLFFLAFSGGLGGFGFGGANATTSGLSQIERDVLTTSSNTQKEILQSRYDNALANQVMQSQLATCCCDLKSAIHSEGETTRALINSNTIQELRDRLNTANNALTVQTITKGVVEQLRPCPVPAYLTCSPYTSFNGGCGNF